MKNYTLCAACKNSLNISTFPSALNHVCNICGENYYIYFCSPECFNSKYTLEKCRQCNRNDKLDKILS